MNNLWESSIQREHRSPLSQAPANHPGEGPSCAT